MEEHVKKSWRERLKDKFKKLLYVFYFFFAFFIAFYWTFPVHVLKGFVVDKLEDFLSQNVSGGGRVHVHIGHLNFWRMTGVSVQDVNIRFPSQAQGPMSASDWELEQLKMRLAIFSTLGGNPKFEFMTRLYEGDISGYVALGGGYLSGVKLDISGLNLGKLTNQEKEDGLPIKGKMELHIALQNEGSWIESGQGEIRFGLKEFKLGPGPMSIPGMIENFPIPVVNLGTFSGEMNLKKGKADMKKIHLKGGDLQGEMDFDFELQSTIILSKVVGGGWFKPSQAFLKKNPAFETILTMLPDLKNAQDDQGRYGFKVDGSLLSPRPKFEKPKKGKG